MKTRTTTQPSQMMGKSYLLALLILLGGLMACESDSNNEPTLNNGQGGSMARFAISANFLYTVNSTTMQVYDISDSKNPIQGEGIDVGFNIETIFAYEGNLFIGSQDGMYIYSLDNPSKPSILSFYRHITSCDPVVAQGNYAYVTLRNGVDCRLGPNLLDILDISDPKNPKLVSSTAMLNPHGLAVSDTILFVCEGEQGLRVMNVANPNNVTELYHDSSVDAFDVIARDTLLILTGKEGIFQYGYSNPLKINQLSQLKIRRD